MSKIVQLEKNFMNTIITIKIVRGDKPTVEALDAIEDGFSEFDRIVKQYTRFNENSELSNLNRNAGNIVSITDEFFMLIEKMITIANESNGAFDPTVIDFLEVYGYDKNYDFSKLDNPDLDKFVEKIKNERPSYKDIKLFPKKKSVQLSKNQKIDLGGIGKGYALDCASEKIKAKGFENFLIDAGGDIFASGVNEKGNAWEVGLKTMNKKNEIEIVGKINLKDEALASSGSWARKVKQFHHLIDPRTGKPSENFKTVFVKAKTATMADAWATAVFVGGKDIKVPEGIEYSTF